MELQKIKSFQVDHTKLDPGMYISRIDGDIITYDIRMKKPNSEPVLANTVLHTIEHIFATFVRSGDFSDKIIYFGPMGCRTQMRSGSPAKRSNISRVSKAMLPERPSKNAATTLSTILKGLKSRQPDF